MTFHFNGLASDLNISLFANCFWFKDGHVIKVEEMKCTFQTIAFIVATVMLSFLLGLYL